MSTSKPASGSTQSPPPGPQPLIPTRYVDVTEQRLYAVSLWVLCQVCPYLCVAFPLRHCHPHSVHSPVGKNFRPTPILVLVQRRSSTLCKKVDVLRLSILHYTVLASNTAPTVYKGGSRSSNHLPMASGWCAIRRNLCERRGGLMDSAESVLRYVPFNLPLSLFP